MGESCRQRGSRSDQIRDGDDERSILGTKKWLKQLV